MRSVFLSSMILWCHIALAQLSGNYTINKGVPASSTNFTSIGLAMSSLKTQGISGTVHFDVVSGSGPYTEQVTVPYVAGVSASRTITIDGHGNTLQFLTGTSSSRSIIHLDSARYFTIKNLRITDGLVSAFTWGIRFSNGAQYNTIDSCTLEINKSSASIDNYMAIVATGSSTSVNTGTAASNNTISNNTISGGQGGIYFAGITGGNDIKANHFVNNTIKDFYRYGVALRHSNENVVEGNDISRAGRATVGFFYGIYNFTSLSTQIIGNKVHNTHDAASNKSGIAYGLYVQNSNSPAGKELLMANNLCHDFNGDGRVYGIYHWGNDGCDYVYNTIVLDGSSTINNANGYHHVSASSRVKLKNNVFYITRASNSNFGIDLGADGTLVDSDYNTIYMGDVLAGQHRVAATLQLYSTLQDWQKVRSGSYDQHSTDADPGLLSNFKPTSALLNGMADPITKVTTDHDGISRNALAPDMGAFEFTPPSNDAGIASIDGPRPICTGSANLTISLTNYGGNDLDSVTIHWTVNGANADSMKYATKLGSGQTRSINVGTITIAGNTDLKVWTTSPNGVKDTINSNDTSMVSGMQLGLSGTYTINRNQPVSATNYISYEDLAEDLSNHGVCGPVVINVTHAPNKKNQNFHLFDVPGTSITNTFTLNANADTLLYRYLSTGNLYSVVLLFEAKHVTINSLVVAHLNTSSASIRGFVLGGGASHNHLNGCSVISLEDEYIGISIAGLDQPNPRDQSSSASNNLIENCTIDGGGYGILFNGEPSAGQLVVNNVIRNNRLINNANRSIRLTSNDSTIIEGNELIVDKFVPSSFSYIGVLINGSNENLLMTNNKILVEYSGASVIYLDSVRARSGNENLFTNNLIYSTNGSGDGISIYNSAGNWFHHNSMNLSGSGTGSITGFNGLGKSDNIQFENNIIVVDGSSVAATAITIVDTLTGIVCDYNDLYIHNPSNGDDYIGRQGFSTYNSLTSWQSAFHNAYDQNSFEVDPNFEDPSITLFKPAAAAIDGIARPVLHVKSDYYAQVRHATQPDPGAIEFGGDDISLHEILTDSISRCGDSNQVVQVVVKNVGYNSQTTHAAVAEMNFDGTTYQLNGSGTKTIATYELDTIQLTPEVNTYDGGRYQIKAYSIMASDVFHENDTLNTDSIDILFTPYPPIWKDTMVCKDVPFTLEHPLDSTSTYAWYAHQQDTVALGIGHQFNITGISDTTIYYVASQSDSGCQSLRIPYEVNTDSLPTADFGFNTIQGDAAFGNLSSSNANSFEWLFGDGNTSTGFAPKHSYAANGTYQVTLIARNACGTDNVTKTVEIHGVGIEDWNSQLNFTLYPNPNDGQFVLEFDQLERQLVWLEVYNQQGQIVLEKMEIAGTGRTTVDLGAVPVGIYYLRLYSETQIFTSEMNVIR